jgi:hypothetical protein
MTRNYGTFSDDNGHPTFLIARDSGVWPMQEEGFTISTREAVQFSFWCSSILLP